MSDPNAVNQYRTKLSTASTILGLALFTALCVVLCIRRYFIATTGRVWPWSSESSESRDPRRSLEWRLDEPRTIAIGGRAKALRVPLIWDVYIQPEEFLRSHKTEEKKTSGQERPLEAELASLQPISIEMLSLHTGGPRYPGPVLQPPLPRPATPPTESAHSSAQPVPPPRAVQTALYPHGVLPTPRFQRPQAPRDPTPAIAQSHIGTPVSVSSVSTPMPTSGRPTVEPQVPSAPLEQASTPTLAPHPLQLTFLVSLPDPSFPSHIPLPPSSQTPLPPMVSSLSPTLGTLTPPPSFLLPSLIVPIESVASWWDLPDEPSRTEGNRAADWESQLRQRQEARERTRGGEDMFSIRWGGRTIGRRV